MSINKLGSAIQQLRISRGLTQEQVAEKVSMAKGSIAQIEQGTRDVSLDSLDKIADALDVPSAFLVVMGSSPTKKNKSVDAFLVALQNLSLATMKAKAAIRAAETGGDEPAAGASKARNSARPRDKRRASKHTNLQRA